MAGQCRKMSNNYTLSANAGHTDVFNGVCVPSEGMEPCRCQAALCLAGFAPQEVDGRCVGNAV